METFIFILVSIGLAGLSYLGWLPYQMGYRNGYRTGHQSGHSKGQRAGYAHGHQQGNRKDSKAGYAAGRGSKDINNETKESSALLLSGISGSTLILLIIVFAIH